MEYFKRSSNPPSDGGNLACLINIYSQQLAAKTLIFYIEWYGHTCHTVHPANGDAIQNRAKTVVKQ